LLLNSGFADRPARALANRISAANSDPDEQAQAAYEAVLGRAPTTTEAARAADFLREQAVRYQAAKQENSALTDLCLVLLNSAEFLYVD